MTQTAETFGERAEIEGVIERIVYENPENGFFVARLRVPNEVDLVTFVGNLMAVSPGETIRIRGRWINDVKWGRQVRAEFYETVLPSTVDGIEKYLSSGLIRGIGKVYAKRMVEAFGIETLRVIDEQPERLRTVEGIGTKRARQIRESWSEQKSIQSIMIFLQGHGISPAQAARIFKRYGDGAVAILRKNPYQLAEEIAGIGFAGADKIAANLDIAKDAPQRLQAGILHVLQRAAGEGHDFLTDAELRDEAAALLEAPPESIEQQWAPLILDGKIVRDGNALYLPLLHAAEAGIDHHLKRLLRAPRGEFTIKIEVAIQWAEKKFKIQLSEEQKHAIRLAADAKALIITGGPGTGKTTLINCLLAIFKYKGLGVDLAAPTGRAAKRMEEATGQPAQTIHRLLEFSPKEGGFKRNEHNPLSADLVVIDETSMVDVQLMHQLLKAVPDYARLFLVGDVDQLPSVGPGNVLLDCIASGIIATATLQTVFRQAAQSGIITNAHRINRGEMPQFNAEDCFFIERDEPEAALGAILELVAQRVPRKFGLDPLREIQVLTPMHRGAIGVTTLNERLQEALNPNGAPLPRRGFRIGDKVIQTRNNYELDVFNGDTGIIRSHDEELQEIEVAFPDRAVRYPYDDVDQLSLAYAITIHKAQGSEYPAVIVPLTMGHYMLLQRNVLYTALTRAKRIVVFVGERRALGRAVGNTETTRRNTRLAERLRNA